MATEFWKLAERWQDVTDNLDSLASNVEEIEDVMEELDDVLKAQAYDPDDPWELEELLGLDPSDARAEIEAARTAFEAALEKSKKEVSAYLAKASKRIAAAEKTYRRADNITKKASA